MRNNPELLLLQAALLMRCRLEKPTESGHFHLLCLNCYIRLNTYHMQLLQQKMDVLNKSSRNFVIISWFCFILNFPPPRKKIPLDKTQVKTHTSNPTTLQQLIFWILSSFKCNTSAKMLRAICTLIRRETLTKAPEVLLLASSIFSKTNPLGQDLRQESDFFHSGRVWNSDD